MHWSANRGPPLSCGRPRRHGALAGPVALVHDAGFARRTMPDDTRRRLLLSSLAGLGFAAGLPVQAQATGGADALLQAARSLVGQLDLADTSYQHGGGQIAWTPPVAAHTDCSGLVNHLLMHVDGYGPGDFARWFGKQRPTADSYHDAIAQGRGFQPLARVDELQPGDLIAIKYLVRREDTGHIMLVTEPPQHLAAGAPAIDGTTQWAVTVIDSSKSGHGPQDTRHRRGPDGRDHPGLGRGVFRLYADAQGRVAGFSWSTLAVSRFVPPQEEHVALGRLVTGFSPPP